MLHDVALKVLNAKYCKAPVVVSVQHRHVRPRQMACQPPHQVLLSKLTCFNFSLEAILWFRSYLPNRKQCVCINNVKSPYLSCSVGVPQGSIRFNLLSIKIKPVHPWVWFDVWYFKASNRLKKGRLFKGQEICWNKIIKSSIGLFLADYRYKAYLPFLG